VLHFDFDRQPTRWAARVACIFTLDDRASQRLSGRGLLASTVRSNDDWLFFGLPGASTWVFADNATAAATRLGNDLKAFLDLPNVRRKGLAAGQSP
jgi:hypothetical protein